MLFETKTIDIEHPSGLPQVRLRWQLDNHLGSSSCELNNSAQVISYEEYHPFGSTSFHTVDSGAEVSAKRYRYTGKERDDETGLYYYGARYYASWLGRWTGCDSSTEDGLNLYFYVRNNPIKFSDPNGNASIETDATSVKLPLITPEIPKIPNPLQKSKTDSGPVIRAYDPQREASGKFQAQVHEAQLQTYENIVGGPIGATGYLIARVFTDDPFVTGRASATGAFADQILQGMYFGRGNTETLVRETMAAPYSPSVTMRPSGQSKKTKTSAVNPSNSEKLIPLPLTDVSKKIEFTNLPERPSASISYSLSVRVFLQKGKDYPNVSDYKQFQEANRQLNEAFKNNPEFAKMMEQLYPGIIEGVKPGVRGAYSGTAPTTDLT